MTASEEPAPPASPGPTYSDPGGSARVAQARRRTVEHLDRERGALRPLGLGIIVVVVASSAASDPPPGLHGDGLGVTLALGSFVATLAFAMRDVFLRLGTGVQTEVIAAMGGAGVALTALQPRTTTGIAGATAVWIAFARLPLALGVAVGAAATAGLAVAAALAGVSASGVLATSLLCVLLGLIARFVRQARESQARTEVLLAQLEDARDEQARAAAVAERGRIASELHDVLAHSLSGAAIQLQAARVLVDREQADARVRAAIERAGTLVREGLASAREAVGALRGDRLPGVAQLPALIESYRRDLHVDAALQVAGDARALPTEADLGLYRAAQEALTNVARHAPGAPATVVLRYGDASTVLTVENGAATNAADGASLAEVGGGRGLDGMRERIERAGGTMQAGATDRGWRVELEVPA